MLINHTALKIFLFGFTYSEEGAPGRAAAPPSPLLAVPNVTAHPSTASDVPKVMYQLYVIRCGTLNGY